jgi:sodium/proline symporter
VSAVLVGFVVYLGVVLVAGALTYRLTRTQDDFLLAGRRLNVWVATFSERASGESAWLLLGLPAAAMTAGLVESWTALGSVAGIAFAWWVVAAPLRRETARLGALTLPEYFSARFGAQANAIRITATGIILFFYAFYLAAQFNGAGKILNVSFEIPHGWGMAIGAGVVVAYTMAGGFIAVAWTDLIQAIIMFTTLVVLPIVGLYELSERGLELGAGLAEYPNLASWTGGKTGLAAAAGVLGGLSWGFGYCGQPHTVTRFMSVASDTQIRAGRVIALAWAIPAFAGAVIIGLVGVSLYDVMSFDGGDIEHLMPRMAVDLLPGWLAGILISGAIAAMMSTADSQLLVGTSAVAEDVIHKGLRRDLTPRQLVTVSRVVTLGLGVAGFLLAVTSDRLVLTLVSYAWSGLAASFGPALVLALHWRGTSGRGVLAGMIVGALTTIVWGNLGYLGIYWNELLSERVVAFGLAAVTVVSTSLLLPDAAKGDESHPA